MKYIPMYGKRRVEAVDVVATHAFAPRSLRKESSVSPRGGGRGCWLRVWSMHTRRTRHLSDGVVGNVTTEGRGNSTDLCGCCTWESCPMHERPARKAIESADVVAGTLATPSTKTSRATTRVVRRFEAHGTSRTIPVGCRRVLDVFEDSTSRCSSGPVRHDR